MSTPTDPIEEYLDLLYVRLRIRPRRARRVLAEAEDHLREAAAQGMAAGLTEREAQEAAISSFGSVRAVVRAHDARLQRFPAVAVLRDLVLAAWMLGTFGLLAVGASGLVVAGMNLLFGPRFVGGTVPAGAKLAASSCQGWLADNPGAHGCAQAAMLETSVDAVSLRIAAGLLGLLLLAGYRMVRRDGLPGALPEAFIPTVAVSLFGAATAGLVWLASTGAVVGATSGPGFFLSGALVALAAAAAFVPRLRRALLRHARG